MLFCLDAQIDASQSVLLVSESRPRTIYILMDRQSTPSDSKIEQLLHSDALTNLLLSSFPLLVNNIFLFALQSYLYIKNGR